MSTPPTAPVGIGIALWPHQTGLARLTSGIPVRLSSFTTRPVSVDYRVETLASVVASGSLVFQPGETVRLLPPVTVPSDTPVVRIALSNPTGGEITGNPTTYLGASSSGPAPPTVSLIATGSVWRYWDTNVAPPAGWQNPAFDDSGWRSGAAELGYGDGDERTLIRSTNASGARVLTAYFRHFFDQTNPAGFAGLSWQLRRDDGAVVWLNGAEAFRQNMPSGPIAHTNFAASVVNNATAERALNPTNTSAAALRPGINVVAVEVHQSDAGSSDISFELALSGQPAGNAPTLRHQRFNNELVFWWNDPASVLEVATHVTGPWVPAAPANSPSGQPIVGNRFYRLRR